MPRHPGLGFVAVEEPVDLPFEPATPQRRGPSALLGGHGGKGVVRYSEPGCAASTPGTFTQYFIPSKGSSLAFVYDMTVDPDAENNTHAYALAMVGYNKSVLEVGCATGYFTKAMVERGCKVVGIELDPAAAAVAEEWAERVVVGDIDRGDIWDQVDDESFDVVLCGDVLEHLRDPLGALRSAVRKLKPEGVVVASLPNVAHGDVRLALLRGSFRYRDLGLLDRTHIRFFTLETARELFRDAGLLVVDTKRVIVPLFGSELDVPRHDVLQSTVDEILTDPEAESYQFVVKAVRDNGVQATAALADRIGELTDNVAHEGVRTALLRHELAQAAAENAALREHVTNLREQVGNLERHIGALDGHIAGLDQTIAHLNGAFAESDARYRALLATKAFRLMAPFRQLYGSLRSAGRPAPPEGK
jgi:2-polyprenyl-3-methyl-5-hydroxy-6-metoxy-1,4-benzoquinol methylase